jgi:hypothetical protein
MDAFDGAYVCASHHGHGVTLHCSSCFCVHALTLVRATDRLAGHLCQLGSRAAARTQVGSLLSELGAILAGNEDLWQSLDELHAIVCKRLVRDVQQAAPWDDDEAICGCIRELLPHKISERVPALHSYYVAKCAAHCMPENSDLWFPLAAVAHCDAGPCHDNREPVLAGALPRLRSDCHPYAEDGLRRHLVRAAVAQCGAEEEEDFRCDCRPGLVSFLADPPPWCGHFVAAAQQQPCLAPDPVLLAASSRKCARQRVVELRNLTMKQRHCSSYTGQPATSQPQPSRRPR